MMVEGVFAAWAVTVCCAALYNHQPCKLRAITTHATLLDLTSVPTVIESNMQGDRGDYTVGATRKVGMTVSCEHETRERLPA